MDEQGVVLYRLWNVLTLCTLETPKRVFLQTGDSDEMLHFIRVLTFAEVKKIFRDLNTSSLEKSDLWPFTIYNIQSHSYSIICIGKSIRIQRIKAGWLSDQCYTEYPNSIVYLNFFFIR